MGTKFILHGGRAGDRNAKNDAFFKEVLKDVSSDVRVLLVYFAKEADKIPFSKAEDITQFDKNKGNKTLSFEVGDEKFFQEQVMRADVVYLHGGATLRLLEYLKKFSNLRELFEGRTIAGESAGAYVLSAVFYSETEGGIYEGLGLIPVKTICHYSERKEGKLDENNLDLELLLLPDYQYKVFREGKKQNC